MAPKRTLKTATSGLASWVPLVLFDKKNPNGTQARVKRRGKRRSERSAYLYNSSQCSE